MLKYSVTSWSELARRSGSRARRAEGAEAMPSAGDAAGALRPRHCGTDYVKAVPESVPSSAGRRYSTGTDGGRVYTRAALRRFFMVDASIVRPHARPEPQALNNLAGGDLVRADRFAVAPVVAHEGCQCRHVATAQCVKRRHAVRLGRARWWRVPAFTARDSTTLLASGAHRGIAGERRAVAYPLAPWQLRTLFVRRAP